MPRVDATAQPGERNRQTGHNILSRTANNSQEANTGVRTTVVEK